MIELRKTTYIHQPAVTRSELDKFDQFLNQVESILFSYIFSGTKVKIKSRGKKTDGKPGFDARWDWFPQVRDASFTDLTSTVQHFIDRVFEVFAYEILII